MWPVILDPRGCSYRLQISSHSLYRSSMGACIHPILAWFLNSLETCSGRVVRGGDISPLRHYNIMCSMTDSRQGGNLFHSLHWSNIFSLTQVASPLLYCDMCSTYSLYWQQTLGQSSYGHTPLSYIAYPVSIFMKVSLTAHIYLMQVFFKAVWRDFWSILCWWRLSTVEILCQRARRIGKASK